MPPSLLLFIFLSFFLLFFLIASCISHTLTHSSYSSSLITSHASLIMPSHTSFFSRPSHKGTACAAATARHGPSSSSSSSSSPLDPLTARRLARLNRARPWLANSMAAMPVKAPLCIFEDIHRWHTSLTLQQAQQPEPLTDASATASDESDDDTVVSFSISCQFMRVAGLT